MNRKQFIQSQGATCQNWTWSWSFINEADKVIIFGVWDVHDEGNISLIFSEDWEIGYNKKRTKGYKQSRDHIRLIEEGKYKLKTFPIILSNEKRDENGIGPAKIKSFIPELTLKTLIRVGSNWYASDNITTSHLPEEVIKPEQYLEGAARTVSINIYERNSAARAKCLEHYGYKCIVCSFDFEEIYGGIGRQYIHVHHLVPLSEIKKEYILDPINDLRPICPNCHAIIHRTQPALSIEQLQEHMAERKPKTLCP
jgi:5-methylcytosine-specific restriction protein A